MKAGWQVKTLGESCFIARGGSPRPIQEFLTNDADGVNWIKISDATASDKFIFNTKEKIKPSGISRSRLVKEGDFILSNSMSFGRPYVMRTSGCIHDGWLVLSEYEKYFDQDFLYHLLGSPIVFEQFNNLAAGSTVRNLNIELASRVVLPIPPIEQQQRIVAVLDQAFEGIAKARANAEQNLQNARALFESHLQSVFTLRVEGWVEKTLSAVCEIKPPKSEVKKLLKNSDLVSFAPMEDLGINQKYLNPKKQRTLEDAAGSYTYFAEGDVLLAKITPCFENGKLGIAKNLINGIGFGSSEYIVFRPNKELTNEFLYYFLSRKHFIEQGAQRMSGAVGHKRVSKGFIEDYKIAFPSIDLQIEIVKKIDALSKETQRLEALYQRKITLLDELKKSLLQQAFAGEL